jgi:hypothetical protein
MRGLSTRVWRGAALVAALVVLAVPAAWADDPPAPPDPPQSRIQPPVGVMAQARIQPPGGLTAEARVQPPVGITTNSRMQPPVGGPETGEQNLFELFATWLRAQAGVMIQ